MTETYTPPTADVRQHYITGGLEFGLSPIVRAAEFDRWLAAHDAEVAATSLSQKVATLSRWIDDSYPKGLHTEIHVRRRVDKLMEEVGEVGQAVGGWFGENPRKGFTHVKSDVLSELLDVMVTAAGAWESLNGNAGTVVDALDTHMSKLLERVGLAGKDEQR